LPGVSIGARSPGVDRLRGVAILLVLFHHFSLAYRLGDTRLAQMVGADALWALGRNGNYGVTMFFVISGYLITSNAQRRWGALDQVAPGGFYALRAARILPNLLLLLALVTVLGAAGLAIFQSKVTPWLVDLAALSFWMNALVISAGWVNYALAVLWSLSVEEVFYLAFPLFCRVLKRDSWLLGFLAVLVLVGPLYRLTHQSEDEAYLYGYFACFDAIAIGCATAVLGRRVTLVGAPAAMLRAGTALAMAFLYLLWPIGEANILGVSAMALGTAVLLLARRDRPGIRWLGWFGRLSYELYLFHLIVLGLLRTVFPPRETQGDIKTLLLVAFLLLSAGLAGGIARFFAEPLNRRFRRSDICYAAEPQV
jgi:peptidoglycan/LPS O-acetylase OafA/YrhL